MLPKKISVYIVIKMLECLQTGSAFENQDAALLFFSQLYQKITDEKLHFL